VIPIFPERMLDGSIHTAVLIGLIVVWLLCESFGFVFAGFVVPGYLAALAIVAPMSLGATVVEAVLTYGVVWAIGRAVPRTGLWSPVFGRERFLLFIVVSVPVRLVVEGMAAPGFEAMLQPWFKDPLWEGARFFGIGVVLVPLLSNAFWKIGLGRGMVQIGISTLVVWAVLTGVLIPLTNFHFGGFEVTFEDVAMDFLAVPKVYVVLVVVAFVAARNNVRYGWDFGGILIPALLAIIAFTPLKLAITLAEIVVLVNVYRWGLKLPVLRDLDLGGPRRIVSMYVLSYGLKWLVATTALHLAPQAEVSDSFGFGYLLTSLVAVRCLVKGHTGRTLVTLLFTTGQGLLLALAVSLGLGVLLPERQVVAPTVPPAPEVVPLERSVLLARASVRESWPESGESDRNFSSYIGRFRRMVERGPGALDLMLATDPSEHLRGEVAVREDGTICAAVRPDRHDATPTDGRPALWWCGGGGPVLHVPRPVGDPDSLWIAAWLAHRTDVAGVWVGGIDEARTNPLTSSMDGRLLGQWKRIRAAIGDRPVVALATSPSGPSWLDPRSPEAVDALQGRLGLLADVPVQAAREHGALQGLWSRLSGRDALLVVSVEDVDARLPPVGPPTGLEALLEAAATRPVRLTTRSQPDLQLATVEVVLGRALRMSGPALPPSAVWLANVLGIAAHAALDDQGRPYVVLDETPEAPAGFGTWVLKPGTGAWPVAAPYAGGEPGVRAVARHVFDTLDARVLWLAGHGREFGAGDALDRDLQDLPLEPLALREALRAGSDPRLLVLRSQPLPVPGRERAEGLVLSPGQELLPPSEREALVADVAEAFRPWPGLGLDDGRAETASLSSYGGFPTRYLAAIDRQKALVGWFATDLLAEVSGTPAHALRVAWYESHGVPVYRIEELAPLLGAVDREASVDGPPALLKALRHHVDTLDEASLNAVRTLSRGEVRVLDSGLRLAVLASDGATLCAAVAGNPGAEVRFPLDGCWPQASGRAR
jgi:gamma-polyglutamate biosynthesis protein CapC